MAIPISRFASVTGDIAKAQGDGKAFSSLPGADGRRFFMDPILKRRSLRRTNPQISTTAGFGRIPIILSLFTIPAQKFVIALIDSSRSHP
ncbi:hypothetical protein [Rhizobium sp. L43]|uniref:hypothetical protein n=1 Tax=Rhizobium sp. L43 TaxID=2035452 RepID=UPI00117A7FB3|nr:hypothetical protein [Rhizobium sp. L43]